MVTERGYAKMKILILVLTTILLVGSFYRDGLCDEDTAQKLLKQGVLGAATGAVAAGTSGGKAGQGALVGAGVNIVGGMLFDAMSGKQVEKVETVQGMNGTEAFQNGYQAGYQQGFEKGYSEGYKSGLEYKK